MGSYKGFCMKCVLCHCQTCNSVTSPRCSKLVEEVASVDAERGVCPSLVKVYLQIL